MMDIKRNHPEESKDEILSSTNTGNDPLLVCEVLRQQNDALRQELHDIRREMDEITDQFRTEDAEEFKQIQAELEVAAKNCRILQFKLRKAEKRYENLEAEKISVEEKLQQVVRDHHRVRDFDEELLVAKEVSVRLHNELEKSEDVRLRTEKLNLALKEQLDTVKELLDQNLNQSTSDDYQQWQLTVYLYESLFREYILTEELTWLNAQNCQSTNHSNSKKSTNNADENLSDLLHSYQQKISLLHEEISGLKENLLDREKDICQLQIQCKILKQRSRSVDRNSSDESNNNNNQRSRRGISVDGGGNLREQLEAANDEIRLLKNKLLRLEDELNNSIVEKESLLAKAEEQHVDPALQKDLRWMVEQIENLNASIKDSRIDQKIVTDLQQLLRSSRWSKDLSDEQLQNRSTLTKSNEKLSIIVQKASEFATLLESKQQNLEKIRSFLHPLTYETCNLLEELETVKTQFDEKQKLVEHLQNSMKILQEKFEQQKSINTELQQDNTRLSSLNAKQNQDLKHLDQLRQSIMTFEKKLDQKQTRVNELSMKIIEKEDIIETKVKECQKHRLELRELESKYYNLGKQLEEEIISMSKEMEKLNVEKEMLRADLETLRKTDRSHPVKSAAEEEINKCRQQIFEAEIESSKLRLNQSINEKDDLIKIIKEMEKKYKDLQLKFDVNEQSWTRLKSEMTEKQRKYDESIKLKSELQNAVDRLRQKLHDLEVHSQEKQTKYAIDKQQWEIQRLEQTGKINELEEQLSKVTRRQRKDLESSWKKERQDLQKQLQLSQQTLKDFHKQVAHRDAPNHLTEKINVLITENELLLNKIKELENVVDDVQLLKSEMSRLREKNGVDWNFWRKQQSDLYAQLRQQQTSKEVLLNRLDRLQKQVKVTPEDFLLDETKTISIDDHELPHGTVDGRSSFPLQDIVGTMDLNKQKIFDKTYSAQENTAASLEQIATKIDRVEDHLFSYRRFMDFIRAKSEKASSVARDDSFTNIVHQANNNNKRLASAPPENLLLSSQRRSRMDATINTSHEHLPSTHDDPLNKSDLADHPTTSSANQAKHRFFSLSRRFRFRTQSPETNHSNPIATVHFLDEDIDLETKEARTRKSDHHSHKPSKGILKTLRHRSPFRFRSKDAVIIEQEPSPPKETKKKVPPSTVTTKPRGRLVELKKTSTSKKPVNVTPINDASASSLIRRTSGLKDLIHKFEATPPKSNPSIDDSSMIEPTKAIDIPDLLQNVEKDPMNSLNKPPLRHSNSNRQTASFDSTSSMISACESISTTTSGNTRKPTSTARPLMLSVNKEETP